jgi:hypothetical protein
MISQLHIVQPRACMHVMLVNPAMYHLALAVLAVLCKQIPRVFILLSAHARRSATHLATTLLPSLPFPPQVHHGPAAPQV